MKNTYNPYNFDERKSQHTENLLKSYVDQNNSLEKGEEVEDLKKDGESEEKQEEKKEDE